MKTFYTSMVIFACICMILMIILHVQRYILRKRIFNMYEVLPDDEKERIEPLLPNRDSIKGTFIKFYIFGSLYIIWLLTEIFKY